MGRGRLAALDAEQLREMLAPAKKYVRSPSMLPITCAKPFSSIPAMSTCIEMVLKA